MISHESLIAPSIDMPGGPAFLRQDMRWSLSRWILDCSLGSYEYPVARNTWRISRSGFRGRQVGVLVASGYASHCSPPVREQGQRNVGKVGRSISCRIHLRSLMLRGRFDLISSPSMRMLLAAHLCRRKVARPDILAF